MKITFVMDGGDNLSGGHRAIAMFARALRRMGHDITLVARPRRLPSVRDRLRSLRRHKSWIREPECMASHFVSAGVPLRVLDRWRPVCDSDLPDADVVLATWWETADWVFRLSPSKGSKAHLMQDLELWGGPAERVKASCVLPIPKIVMGDWLADVMWQRFHQQPLAVVQCGVDMRHFDAPPRGKQAIPTVGLTYSAAARKGCDISIRAYLLARESIPDLRLLACGNGRVSAELPLPENTIYVEYATGSRLRELYAGCDGWLFGSRQEAFGLPVLEAMACRTPVIGTPAGAAPKLLADGAGILVAPESPQNMAAAIVSLCRWPDPRWRAMSEAAYCTASRWSWDNAVRPLEAALRKVMEGHAYNTRI